MAGGNSITIVIPNYNRKQDILAALESVYEQEYQDFEVIVVGDNFSDAGLLAY